jgi:hypothetical protein
MTFNKLGYIRKDADPRNHILEAKQPPLDQKAIPAVYATDITPFKLPENIFMQAQEPSCVAHTVTWAIMYYHWKATGMVVKLSPRFLYALCKTVDGLPASDGTYLETALNLAKKYGVCEDSYFPNDTTLDVEMYTDASRISPEAKANALNYRIESYSFLSNLSVAGVQNALYQNGIVLIGTDVSDWWWTAPSGVSSWNPADLLPLRPIDAQHPEVSGHAVCLYAYGEPWDNVYPTNFWGMNWWSYAWAYTGRFCYGANYQPTVYEAAVISLANTSPAPIKPSEPIVVPAPHISVWKKLLDFIKSYW